MLVFLFIVLVLDLVHSLWQIAQSCLSLHPKNLTSKYKKERRDLNFMWVLCDLLLKWICLEGSRVEPNRQNPTIFTSQFCGWKWCTFRKFFTFGSQQLTLEV
jgi:hypothetical protein